MSGEALTACFVWSGSPPNQGVVPSCPIPALTLPGSIFPSASLSQAPDNLMQSKIALDFGEAFAKLAPRPRAVKPMPRGKLVKDATSLHAEAKAVLGSGNGGGKYRMMRIAQQRASEQELNILSRFHGGPNKA